MIIFWRVCDYHERTGGGAVRWNGHKKKEIIKTCWNSLQQSIDEYDEIIVVADRTSDELLQWLESNSKTEKFEVKNIDCGVSAEKHPYPKLHPIQVIDVIDLYSIIFERCPNPSEELIYLCEDDYLHIPNALDYIKEIYDAGWKGFVIPYDYPDRYTLDRERKTELMLGPRCHWRTVPSSTLTLCAPSNLFHAFRMDLERAAVFADDGWTWKVYQQVPAICPIPGISTHLTEGLMTPFVNWEKEWERNA